MVKFKERAETFTGIMGKLRAKTHRRGNGAVRISFQIIRGKRYGNGDKGGRHFKLTFIKSKKTAADWESQSLGVKSTGASPNRGTERIKIIRELEAAKRARKEGKGGNSGEILGKAGNKESQRTPGRLGASKRFLISDAKSAGNMGRGRKKKS